ncbi:MAG: potassium channel protein [Bdellovibrionales bacterium]|nr:potassium channel protein [Bdellovibrionales bacterium]
MAFQFFPKSRELREDLFLLGIISVLMIIGTVGFRYLEGWTILESFYMTVITLSTVGFMEVHPLSDAGRIFTSFLIIAGVGVVMVLLTQAASHVVQRQLHWVARRGPMNQRIQNLSGHIIFCGFGRLAQVAVEELRHKNKPLVIIDADESRIDAATEADILAIHGDATNDELLRKAGIGRAAQLVSLLPKDADNLYVILAARELNPNVFTLTRAEFEEGEKRLKRAGASKIISPFRVGGQKIADGLLRPHVMDFLELAASGTQKDLVIEEIRIPESASLHGKTLLETGLREKTQILVVAIVSSSGETIFNPKGDTRISGGTTLIGLGRRVDFEKLESLLIEDVA